MTFQARLAAAYGTAMVILCAMAVVSYRNTSSIEATRLWGRHSSVVLHRVEAFSESLDRINAISFDYAGTGDAAALASMDRISSETLRIEKDIRFLTSDNPSQQRHLDALEPKLQRYLKLRRDAVAQNAALPRPVTLHLSASIRAPEPERAELSREIAGVVQQLNAEEERLALARRLEIDAGLQRSSYLLVFGYASAILLSALCLIILRNEMRARGRVQRELETAQAELEQRVYERTEDLRAANLALRSQIDERKKAEQQVQLLNSSLEMRVEQRTLELTQAVKELDSFCYTVSHDLRAPLRHVDGFSRILESEFGSELSPDARHYLNRIVQAVNQMGRLIDDLLELSRIGRKKLSRKRVSVQELVERLIANYRISEEGRTVEWRVDELPEVNCDPGLLEVVYANLIENAVKFTRDARPRVIQFGALYSAGNATLFVRDNGVGFDPKYADKLFGVFQRLHRQEDFDGTGIGLATVQRIIQRHGGSIRAESQPGCGATFYFTLGAQTAVTPAPRAEEVKHVRA
jgi:signal transduction histidine kinase